MQQRKGQTIGQHIGLGAVLTLLGWLALPNPAHSDDVTVRVERWLSVGQMTGSVSYVRSGESRSARRGDRLQSVGDGIITGKAASAKLEIDTQIGTIEVAEETQMVVQSLAVVSSGGRTTRLRVDRGRVRLQVRPFSNPDSRLDIETPAGVSGVRGTDFGVVVQPDGKMGVATLEGNVATEAQAQVVEVPAGFQNVTIPGEPPSPPVPFTNEPRLDYQLERIIKRGVRRVRLIGQVDPTSTVIYKGEPQPIDQDGKFNLLFPAPSRLKVQITVVTPLGREQTYDLALI